MALRINGQEQDMALETATLMDVVLARGLKPERVVIEYNGSVVPREHWFTVNVVDNDIIEIVSFVGGG